MLEGDAADLPAERQPRFVDAVERDEFHAAFLGFELDAKALLTRGLKDTAALFLSAAGLRCTRIYDTIMPIRNSDFWNRIPGWRM